VPATAPRSHSAALVATGSSAAQAASRRRTRPVRYIHGRSPVQRAQGVPAGLVGQPGVVASSPPAWTVSQEWNQLQWSSPAWMETKRHRSHAAQRRWHRLALAMR